MAVSPARACEDVFDLTHLPASLVVVGGGPIGVELGQAFERLGTRVTLIEGLDRILPKEDPEVSATLTEVLHSEGITIATRAMFVKASRKGEEKVVTAKQGEQFLTFEADEILVTLGRRPTVEGLQLEYAQGYGRPISSRWSTPTPRVPRTSATYCDPIDRLSAGASPPTHKELPGRSTLAELVRVDRCGSGLPKMMEDACFVLACKKQEATPTTGTGIPGFRPS